MLVVEDASVEVEVVESTMTIESSMEASEWAVIGTATLADCDWMFTAELLTGILSGTPTDGELVAMESVHMPTFTPRTTTSRLLKKRIRIALSYRTLQSSNLRLTSGLQ